MSEKTILTDEEIKKSLLSGGKYVIINIMTSFIIIGMLFLIAVMIGFESDNGIKFFSGCIFQTIMLPLIIWYYGYVAYCDGYKHSVSGKYNKNRILLAALPHIIIQLIIVVLTIMNKPINPTESNHYMTLATFILNPYTILFQTFPEFMPEIMILPCFVAPISMYIGYSLARNKEIDDHSIKDDAAKFRKRLEKEQYKYDNNNNSANNNGENN